MITSIDVQNIYDKLMDLRKYIEAHPTLPATNQENDPGSGGTAYKAALMELKKAIGICERNVSHSLDEVTRHTLTHATVHIT